MTNREYLKQELPLWLFNRIVPFPHINNECIGPTEARLAFNWTETKKTTNIGEIITFSDWAKGNKTLSNTFKPLWSKNKDFLFPCTVEEALSILELVEPEFYKFINKRTEIDVCKSSMVIGWHNVFAGLFTWKDSPEGYEYWENKNDFSVSPEFLKEEKEPKTIGEWLDLPENSLIKEIFEFDRGFLGNGENIFSKRNRELCLDNIYTSIPSVEAPYSECEDLQSFQPYIDWYNNHPQNPKNTVKSVDLKDVDEPHSIEWWRDELAKTEPEVAEHLYNEYTKQARLSQTPKVLFGRNDTSFLGGITWDATELGYDIYYDCRCEESFEPLKEALKEKSKFVDIDEYIEDLLIFTQMDDELASSEMPGATFPCTVQERLDWMMTQPALAPIAEYIKKERRESTLSGDRIVYSEFDDRSFVFWCCSDNLIDRECRNAESWEPFFETFPHLRVEGKPDKIKKINEHHQLLVECANIKEVKQLLKHVNQEDAFTHSKRLVVFYDLDDKRIYHVGSTKKSHWKQIPNKVHKRVSVEEFLAEVPMVSLTPNEKVQTKFSKKLSGSTTMFEPAKGTIVVNTSSWFDKVKEEPKNSFSWFD